MKKSKRDGTVYVQFVVDRSGAVSTVDVVKSPHVRLSAVAKELILGLPQFTPAEHLDEKVEFLFTVPVRFKKPEVDKKEIKESEEFFRWPAFPKCNELSRYELKDCFIDEMTKSINENLVYPHEALIEGLEDEILLEFTVDSLGSIGSIEVINGEHPVLIQAAKNALLATNQLTPALSEGTPVSFQIQAPFSFNKKAWLSNPYNANIFHDNYYRNIETKFVALEQKLSDSSDIRSYVKFHFMEIALNKGWSEKELTGHIFSKYGIDSSGSVIPFEYIFENGTELPNRAVNTIMSSIPPYPSTELNKLEKSEMYDFGMFFPERSLKSDSLLKYPTCEKCLHLESNEERHKCLEVELRISINNNTTYPRDFIESIKDVKGTRVYVEFIIDYTGHITNVKVVNSKFEEFNEPSMMAVKHCPRVIQWSESSFPLTYRFTVPVNYRW
ncbi:MAG: energy transducer TonB [Flavobacteriales bacterium]